MKLLKYIIGFIALAFFFFIIDDSGNGFRKHIGAIKKWANGESSRLHFENIYKNQ